MIIGIGHVARTGKDTAAEALVRDLGYKRVAFADKLKAVAMDIDAIVTQGGPMTVNTQVGRGRLAWLIGGSSWEQAKDQYPEVRRLLQATGVAVRKHLGEDIWIEAALGHRNVLPEVDAKRKVVVPDVRFINEAEAIQARGGKMVRINRPGRRAEGHVSETELADWTGWDHEIENNGTVQELQQAIVDYAKSVSPPPLPFE